MEKSFPIDNYNKFLRDFEPEIRETLADKGGLVRLTSFNGYVHTIRRGLPEEIRTALGWPEVDLIFITDERCNLRSLPVDFPRLMSFLSNYTYHYISFLTD